MSEPAPDSGFLHPLSTDNPVLSKVDAVALERLKSQFATLPEATAHVLADSLASLTAAPPHVLAELITEAVSLFDTLTPEHVATLLTRSARLALRSPAAARELLHSVPALSQRLSVDQLEAWCQRGEDLLRTHEAAGVSYFRLQSRQGQEALAELSAMVTLGEVREVLHLYCQALMGRSVSILAAEELQEQANGWVTREAINWEGAAIFAPSRMEEFPSKVQNFEAYKVLATHQAAHLEFGTYDFTFEQEGSIFRPLRQLLATLSTEGYPYLAAYDRYFDLFTDRRLGRDLFTLAEDQRIDSLVNEEYRGIRKAYQRIQEHALAERPIPSGLPLREYVAEQLVRFSLGATSACAAPRVFASHVTTAAAILRLVGTRVATVVDVTEAVIRLYVLLRQIPNVPLKAIPPERWVEVDLAAAQYDPADEDLEKLARAFGLVNQPGPRQATDDDPPDAEELRYTSPPPMHHRGDVRPEVMQALLQLQQQREKELGQDEEVDKSFEDLLRQIEERAEYADAWDALSEGESLDTHLLLSQYLRSLKQVDSSRQNVSPLVENIAEREVQVFSYDEWDYRSKAYRPGWCRLHQRTLKEGSEEFYEETLHRYPAVVHAVRKQFEMLRPENLGRVKRLLDGEEFDLDAVVDSVVGKRSGEGLKDKIYWRRRKTERSVAVALLLDMSLSTDEHLNIGTDQDVPDPDHHRTYKRIIDIEKESLVLMIEALEQIGDSYGIYGFSGSGRGDVQYYNVKELTEPMSTQVKSRIDKLGPLQGTRMGPAIRHTIAQLTREDARTKLLILLSDGRPQDRDYGTVPWELEGPPRAHYRPLDEIMALLGPDGVMKDEKEYAVHDTKAALNEAKRKNIVPFCLSVDKGGQDYLKAMCGDIGYEVVSDIQSLPRRLPSLYRRLTT